MTGKELAYLLEKTGTRNVTFAKAINTTLSGVSHFKRTKKLYPKTEQRIFDAFDKLGYNGDHVRNLLKQRFEEVKKTPKTLADPLLIKRTFDLEQEIERLINKCVDLQSEKYQLKRHIEALELNVKLLTEKLNT